jgi:DNA invertase Pin-like site-specific DNA recombinase
MSTEHQQYSIENQSDAIKRYAASNGMEIVETYADAGKSGLTLQYRKGLQRLLRDVEKGTGEFSAILVYDVSRWGRFQDTDESAYYEYRCKRAKIDVHYCAEPFPNDGSISSTLLKAIKRAMAGEYSRELSVKVSAGKLRLFESGFRIGGSPGYGLRRLLVDQNRIPKGILERGERKSIITDRTLQIPGPPEEIEIVKEIYRMYVQERLAPGVIAARLNQQGLMSEFGGLWTRAIVLTIVTNPKYTGANVTNRKSYKLGTNGRSNPREKWILRENIFEPIIDRETFQKAQATGEERARRYTDDDLLGSLKKLLDRTGKLSVALIDGAVDVPNSRIYGKRFGSLFEAYRRVGYDHGRRISAITLGKYLRDYRRDLLNTIVAELTSEGAAVRQDARSGLVTVNGEFTLRLTVAPCDSTRPIGCRWALRLASTMNTDITIVARMSPANDRVQDYFVVPRTDGWTCQVTVAPEDDFVAGVYRFDDISFLKSLARRTKVKEAL